jgi:hypothetical protein
MVWKRALERWEPKLANCEVTHQAIWPIAKSLTKWGGPKAQSGIYGPLGSIFYSIDEANIIAECLERQFRACILSISQYDSSMYEAGGTHHLKCQQYVNGCCVLGY